MLCRPVGLPPELLVPAARLACEVNPANAPRGGAPTPLGLAARTAKLWRAPADLSVQFLDNPTAACKALILSHANAWGERGARVRFRETTGTGLIRVARAPGGYWSYVGTDALVVPPDRATMNLEGWTEHSADGACRRVVRHEAGHAIGMEHEHLRRELVALLNPISTIVYYRNAHGWDEATTRANVLTPLEDASLTAGPTDPASVMCYQIPGSCTYSGEPIPGGLDLTPGDLDTARKVYPGSTGGAFAFDLAGPGKYLLEVPAGWGVTAWTGRTVAFAEDSMIMPDARPNPLLCVPEPHAAAVGPAGKVVIDAAAKHATVPPGWVVRVGVGVYQPGRPGAERNVVVLAARDRKTVLLPSGHGWQSAVG